MIKYANNLKLYGYIKTIFESIINNQVTPYIFNTSIIKPIVKNSKKSYKDLSNLRPIAVSDIISNLFESVLLGELNHELIDHPKQFGFKSQSSCQHAIWSLRQAIEHGKQMKNWIYMCAIDASKAYDKINRTTLWKRLIEKNLSPCIITGLINYYNESLIVANDGEYSKSFKSIVGVRQGVRQNYF